MWIFSGVCVHAFVNTCLCVCVSKLGYVSTLNQCRPSAFGAVMASLGNQKKTLS